MERAILYATLISLCGLWYLGMTSTNIHRVYELHKQGSGFPTKEIWN